MALNLVLGVIRYSVFAGDLCLTQVKNNTTEFVDTVVVIRINEILMIILIMLLEF